MLAFSNPGFISKSWRLVLFASILIQLPLEAQNLSAWQAIPLANSVRSQVVTEGEYRGATLINEPTFGWAARTDTHLILGNSGQAPLVRRVPDSVAQLSSTSLGPTQIQSLEDGLLWGNWCTHDGGQTWKSLPLHGYSNALVLSDSYWIADGWGYDIINRSQDHGKTWAEVHFGRTYGYNFAILALSPQTLLAFPAYDEMTMSLDSGLSWQRWDTTKTEAYANYWKVEACAATTKAGGPAAYIVTTPFRDSIPRQLTLVRPLLHQAITLTAKLPDSIVTALVLGPGNDWWLGTRGQGVWHSPNQGGSWEPYNEGLLSLHVTGLVYVAPGNLVVMTTAGLASRNLDNTSVVPLKPRFQRNDYSNCLLSHRFKFHDFKSLPLLLGRSEKE
jgi:hypothetical protein